jgi:AcrR family transcriptional regulator
MRRAPAIRFEPLAAAVASGPGDDDVTDAILDAAAAVLAAGGLRHCTVEEVAARGRLGRTTIYRRFDGRDDLIHAVLAREVRRGFAAISAAVAHHDRFEDRVVEGMLAGLRAVERSPLLPLVRSEPELQRLLTVEAGPLVQVAVAFLVEEDERLRGRAPTARARHAAELLVRFSSSLALAPDTSLPLDDDEAARAALHALLDPLLGAPE